ncbi:hypothetical protein [Saccharothrix sp. HUAS TT1]|uniref:hypothetical protein n=1 Tax=unclassified Saccharothrix TaxID=2593673 RepID=UPI00345BDE8E
MTLSVNQVQEILENHVFVHTYWNDSGEYEEQGWHEWAEVGTTPVAVPDFGTVEIVEDIGGYEDGGGTRYLTFKVTDEEGRSRFFRKHGYYSSYDGSDWDGDFQECAQKAKVVTVYEPIR